MSSLVHENELDTDWDDLHPGISSFARPIGMLWHIKYLPGAGYPSPTSRLGREYKSIHPPLGGRQIRQIRTRSSSPSPRASSSQTSRCGLRFVETRLWSWANNQIAFLSS
uniref:Uncharacterized protein n=1 Tax=Lutzomyia longipalpis TaxID=7200 RepID=A0A1B0CKR8_LUTLO